MQEIIETLRLPQKQFHMVLQGHVLSALKRLPAESVDCVVTSPPYWGLRDYKIEPIVWDGIDALIHEHQWGGNLDPAGYRSNDNRFTETLASPAISNRDAWQKSNFCSLCGAWRGQLGLEPTFQLYVQHILQVTEELKRVLKPTGCLWLNLGDTYATHTSKRSGQFGHDVGDGANDVFQSKREAQSISEKSLCFIPQRIALGMIDEQGWILRNFLVWYKSNGMPSSVRDRFSNKWEPMFFFVKEPRYWFDLDAVRTAQKIKSLSRYNYAFGGAKAKELRQSVEFASSRTRPIGEREYNFLGKNPGDVLQINTQPHPFAHFAVYPEKLVERPIKASCPAEICVTCGKATERIGKTDYIVDRDKPKDFEPKSRESGNSHYRDWKFGHGWALHNTLGWTSCSCEPQSYRPGIVLDPFAGSGTTSVVAKKLGRSSIAIELNPEYVTILKQRMDWGRQTLDPIEWLEF